MAKSNLSNIKYYIDSNRQFDYLPDISKNYLLGHLHDGPIFHQL
jgi:hypothetical protein